MSDKKKCGMYGETPVVAIGDYTICEFSDPADDTVWIQHKDAEGGQFSKEKLRKCIATFYTENL